MGSRFLFHFTEYNAREFPRFSEFSGLMVDALFFTLWKKTRLTFKLFAIFFPLAVDDFYFISRSTMRATF